jgi:hypothetical protein
VFFVSGKFLDAIHQGAANARPLPVRVDSEAPDF